MCCTGSRHNRPTLSHAELMRERERARKNMPKDDPRRREMGAYRAKAAEPRCGDCGRPKPADGLRTCLDCRATALLRTRKSQAAAKQKKRGRPPTGRAARAVVADGLVRGPCEVCGREVSRRAPRSGPVRCVHAKCEAASDPSPCSRCKCRPALAEYAYCQRCKDYTDARDARHRDRIARQRGESEPTPRKEAA